jgi:hypothetical protein
MKFVFFVVFLFVFLSSSTTGLIAQPVGNAAIEDAAVDNADATVNDKNKSENQNNKDNIKAGDKNDVKENENDKSQKNGKWEYRFYSIGGFSYQPISDTTHLAVAGGLFQEKNSAAEMNLEMTHHTELPHDATIVVKVDTQGKISSQYASDSYFFKKGAGDWLKLNELFFDATNRLGMSVLVGKYRRIFSPGLFQNPMDRHNPKSTLPGEPAQREGAWLAQLALDGDFKTDLLSRWRISGAYLPGFFLDKNGIPVSTRDKFIYNPRSPLGATKTTENYGPEYQGAMARLYLDFFKGDFNAVYYYTEKQHQEGISYSRYFMDRLEWHGEILFYEKPRSDLTVIEPERNFFVDALTGFRLDIGDDITLALEYLYRQENRQNYPDAAIDQRKLWLSQLSSDSGAQSSTPMRHYLVVSLMAVNLKDLFDVTLNVITNPFDQEYLFSLRTDYKVDKSSKISLAGLVKYGADNTFYGNFFPFDYQVRVEFYIALL